MSTGSTGRVKSADRSLDVLELLAAHADGLTLPEMVDALGWPKSSLHALLQTLAARRYVEQAGPDRRHRLGLRAAELSAGYIRSHGLLARARAAVAELAARSRETVHLAVLDDTDVLYLMAEESEHSMRLVSPLGGRIPAHATAAGKVLLASLTDAEIATRVAAAGLDPTRLPRLTWRTLGSLADLLRELGEVRRLGHAHDAGGYAEGVHCIAAPVLDAGGSVGAALSISVPTPRLNEQRLLELTGLVTDMAARASRVSSLPSAHPWSATGDPWTPGNIRVAWSMGSMLVPSYTEMHRAAAAAATAHGADMLWCDAAEDGNKQACDVRHLLALQPDVLVLHSARATYGAALLREAAAAGVPALCYQRPVRSDAFALFAGGDTFHEGVLQVQFVAEQLQGAGNVVLLEGDAYNDNARNVAEGNRTALSSFPGLRLLADEVCPLWSRALAKEFASDLLDRHGPGDEQGSGVHAIICANDQMAGGVAEALAERGWTGRVVLVGGDGDQDALERLRTGAQAATVFQDPRALAEQALTAALALARGPVEAVIAELPRRSLLCHPPTQPVPVLDVPYQLITPANCGALEAYWRSVTSSQRVAAALPNAGG